MPHWKRTMLLMALDAALINIAVFGSFYLRFYEDSIQLESYLSTTYICAAIVATVVLLVVYRFVGLYHSIWRYASVRELVSIAGGSGIGVLIMVGIVYGMSLVMPAPPVISGSPVALEITGIPRMPHSVGVLCWLMVAGLVGFSRFLPRVQQMGARMREGNGALPQGNGSCGLKPVLIIGAGDAGALALRELRNYHDQERVAVGFVDDSAEKLHLKLQGIPVLGTRHDIARIVEEYDVEEIIIALPSVTGEPLREIINLCQDTHVSLKILPRVYDFLSGDVTVSTLREVQVEDLLQRNAVSLELNEVAGYLKDQVVLVTGAGGSIGSELCRQLVRFNPAQLILTGHGENSIFDIEQELRALSQKAPNKMWPALAAVIMDIRDVCKVGRVFAEYRPGVVFHAAAHKHVPLMEDNPEQAMLNNILGTHVLARAAHDFHVNKFVLVSSDKAVNPTSIMGATKRVAEMVIQDLGARSHTQFAAVRFGNVLGSRGSVVPTFKRQIAAGGPVTVTDPEMTRYFMTIPEASQLVIQAGAMAEGGEIFILDMGRPVKIVDLAKDLIRLSGLKEEKDIQIVYTGVRPGEKLYEELLTAEEGTRSTRHERIFIARASRVDAGAVEGLIDVLKEKGGELEPDQVVGELQKLLPDFREECCEGVRIEGQGSKSSQNSESSQSLQSVQNLQSLPNTRKESYIHDTDTIGQHGCCAYSKD
ncbi:MAG: polysaccharide biosynthesis protein [Peptococcaceae bacterium]|nr:polysaccharide biosynthesis protein [Peptococcaceae bacterium]